MIGDMALAMEILGQHHASCRQQSRVSVARCDPYRTVEPHHELTTRGTMPIGTLVHGMSFEELQAINSNSGRDTEFDDAGGRRGDNAIESDLLEMALSVVIGPDPQIVHRSTHLPDHESRHARPTQPRMV